MILDAKDCLSSFNLVPEASSEEAAHKKAQEWWAKKKDKERYQRNQGYGHCPDNGTDTAVNKTETRHGKIAKPLSQSKLRPDEKRYKKEQELLPDDFDVDRTRVCKLNALGVSAGSKQQFSELSALVARAQGILCLTMNMLQSAHSLINFYKRLARITVDVGKQPRGKGIASEAKFW